MSSIIPQKRLIEKTTEKKSAKKQRKNSSSIRQSSKIALFIQLARPDDKGVSRWVQASEWVGEYAPLALGNGLSWGRKNSKLSDAFVIEVDRSQTNGNSIDAIRLNGFKENKL